jgi:hypothetical protein
VSVAETEHVAGWRELNKPWHNTAVDYCEVCGNLLIRRYWEFVGADGETLRACRRDDERLYHLLRRHRGQTQSAPA